MNNRGHLADFIRLNDIWIKEHFVLEEADRALAANPGRIIDEGGFIFSALLADRVEGVCALFRDSAVRYQLGRMAVAPEQRGAGIGGALMDHALQQARLVGATSVYLLSNTVLHPAISLYRRFGFVPIATGQHPVYARCNIVMERSL